MDTDLIGQMTETFEGHAQHADAGVEYWLARDIQFLLGYTKWDNFQNVLTKAKTACDIAGHKVVDNFADVGKMVELGSGATRAIDDVMLMPDEDIKKVERRVASDERKSLAKPDRLED